MRVRPLKPEEAQVLGTLTTRRFRMTAVEDEGRLSALSDPGQGFVCRRYIPTAKGTGSLLTRAGAHALQRYKEHTNG